MDVKKIPGRILLYSRDIENITGKSRRTSQRLIQKIRQIYGDSGESFVTMKEVCKHLRLEEEDVMKFIKA
jgi:hypothetical protein